MERASLFSLDGWRAVPYVASMLAVGLLLAFIPFLSLWAL